MKIWNEYPTRMPKNSGEYWVTISYMIYDGTEYRRVERLGWSNVHKKWNCSDHSDDTSREIHGVIAWTYLSSLIPYLGGEWRGKTLEID